MDQHEKAMDLAATLTAASLDMVRARFTLDRTARERMDRRTIEIKNLANSLLKSPDLAVAVLARLAHDLAAVALGDMLVSDERLAHAVLDGRATENSLANVYAQQAVIYALEQASGDPSRQAEADREIDQAQVATASEQAPLTIVKAAYALADRIASLNLAHTIVVETRGESLPEHELAATFMGSLTGWPTEQFV